ncbi:transposase-like protein [Vespula maculifrons]|uniref:Transposase-like protein n=1 Tax=Vespula maculifrons TaxID=7453 RepID=A0ABD2AQL6_VESMC
MSRHSKYVNLLDKINYIDEDCSGHNQEISDIEKDSRLQIDQFALISEVWYKFIENSQNCYKPRLYPPMMNTSNITTDNFWTNASLENKLLAKKKTTLITNQHFLSTILFADETEFSMDRIINFHNTHHGIIILITEENPHTISHLGYELQFSVNLWAGILGNNLIELILLDKQD